MFLPAFSLFTKLYFKDFVFVFPMCICQPVPFQRASGRITEYFPSIFIFHFPLHRLAPNSAPILSSSQIDLLYLSFLFYICPSSQIDLCRKGAFLSQLRGATPFPDKRTELRGQNPALSRTTKFSDEQFRNFKLQLQNSSPPQLV